MNGNYRSARTRANLTLVLLGVLAIALVASMFATIGEG